MSGGGEVRAALQVEDDMLLAAVERRISGRRKARPARRIDVKDLGALIAQQHRGQRPRDPLTEVDDPDPVERAHAMRYSPPARRNNLKIALVPFPPLVSYRST